DIVMDQRVTQLYGRLIHYDMFVNLDVGHRRILILQAAFETASPFTEQGLLPEACIAMSQDPSEKIHLQPNGVSVDFRVSKRVPNFCSQFRCQDFIRIEQ